MVIPSPTTVPALYLRRPGFGEDGVLDDYVGPLARAFQKNPGYRAKYADDWQDHDVASQRARQRLHLALQTHGLQYTFVPAQDAGMVFGPGTEDAIATRVEEINEELSVFGVVLRTRSRFPPLS